MFKKTKQFIRNNGFLNDKYKEVVKGNVKEETSFLSDMQIKEILKYAPNDGKFNTYLIYLSGKSQLRIVDLLYSFLIMFLMPSAVAYFFFDKVFRAQDINLIISIGGSFGAFMIALFSLVYLTSNWYAKLVGGNNLKEVNKLRAFNFLCNKIRKSRNINNAFYYMVNYDNIMTPSYKEKTLNKEDQRINYNEIKIEEYTNIEKKLLCIMLKEIEDIYFSEINDNF